MNPFPLRLLPGADLRRAVEECLAVHGQVAAFVLSGIGSLGQGRIRYAGQREEAAIAGPLELLSLAGSISPEGAHLHMAVSTASGQVLGGHVCHGNTIGTTAELLIAFLPEWRFSREYDNVSGYRELVVRSSPSERKSMFDHVGFGVTDIARSKAFFLEALRPLGVAVVMEGPYGVGMGRNGKPSLWLFETNEVPARLHIAFAAASRAEVDAFYRAALAAGGKDNGAPGLRPHYHPNYYGAFVIGPDGHNLEAVCHAPE